MTNRIALSAACLAFSALSFLSLPASAGLINSGDKLGYDQTTNLMWYTAFDLSGSYFNTYDVLSQLPNSTELNGNAVYLSWSLASLQEINTLDFTDKTVFEAFYGAPASSLQDYKIFWGFTRDTAFFDYDPNAPHARMANRGVFYNSGNDALGWYDDYSPYGDSDPWIDLLQANQGQFWLVANVHSVPEPSSLLLLLSGLLGLAGFRRKSSS